MAEGEGIRYSDLIMDDGALDRAIEKLKELRKYYADTVEDIKRQAKELKDALDGVPSSSLGGGTSKRLSPATDAGRDGIAKMQREAQKLAVTMEEYQAALSKADKMIEEYNIAQTEATRLTRLIVQENQAAEGSYNKLSKQYSILKMQLNAMSDEMRRNTKEGQLMERQAYEIYQKMIMLQEATGKHTLSVGNYGKALNGLNNATAQVVRELPALAISANTFFLAISNNIPILVDQINLLRQQNAAAAAQGQKGVSIIKAVAKSFLSWNTVLTLVITAVAMFGDKLIGLIANLFKAKKELDVNAEAMKVYKEAADNARKSEEEAIVTSRMLYDIATDATRSMEDRLSAVHQLQNEYPDYLGNISDEVILTGQAKTAYDNLTQSLVENARAKAYLHSITEQQSKIVEAEIKQDNIRSQIEAEEAKLASLTKGLDQSRLRSSTNLKAAYKIGAIDAAENRLEKLNKELDENQKDIDIAEKTIEYLTGKIPVDYITNSGTGEKAKETIWHELEFVRQAEDERIALMEDGMEKELAQNRVKYQRQIEDLQRMLETEKNITAKGQEAIRQTIIYLSKRMYQEEFSIRSEYYRKAVEEERQFRQELEKAVEEGIESAVAAEVADSNSIDAMFSDLYRQFEETADVEYQQQLLSIERMKATEEEKTRLRLLAEKERLQNTLENNAMLDQLDEKQVLQIQTKIAKIENQLSSSGTKDGKSGSGDIFSLIFPNDKDAQKKAKAYTSAFSKAVDSIVGDLEYLVQKRQEAADKAVENADRAVAAAQNALDQELEARNAGYANNVDTARKELALAKENQQKALAEQRRVNQEMVAIQSIQQASSLTSAIASLYASLAPLGPAGVAAATALSAVMFASFIADWAWPAVFIPILICGVPIIWGAIVGVVKEHDITADVLVSVAIVASVIIGEYDAAAEIA